MWAEGNVRVVGNVSRRLVGCETVTSASWGGGVGVDFEENLLKRIMPSLFIS